MSELLILLVIVVTQRHHSHMFWHSPPTDDHALLIASCLHLFAFVHYVFTRHQLVQPTSWVASVRFGFTILSNWNLRLTNKIGLNYSVNLRLIFTQSLVKPNVSVFLAFCLHGTHTSMNHYCMFHIVLFVLYSIFHHYHRFKVGLTIHASVGQPNLYHQEELMSMVQSPVLEKSDN